MKTFKTVTTQEITAMVCDGCGLQASAGSDYDFHEFISRTPIPRSGLVLCHEAVIIISPPNFMSDFFNNS
jgi:hypothetical protein